MHILIRNNKMHCLFVCTVNFYHIKAWAVYLQYVVLPSAKYNVDPEEFTTYILPPFRDTSLKCTRLLGINALHVGSWLQLRE